MYRYSEKIYNDSLLNMGIIRIGTLHDFRNKEKHKIGVADEMEGVKTIRSSFVESKTFNTSDKNSDDMLRYFGIKSAAGTRHTFTNSKLERNHHHPNCFVLCTSSICSLETMREFKGNDSCVEIFDKYGFYKTLTETLYKITPVKFYGIHEIKYQSRIEPYSSQLHLSYQYDTSLALIKDEQFKKQYEMRAIWMPLFRQPIKPQIIGNYNLASFCREVLIGDVVD